MLLDVLQNETFLTVLSGVIVFVLGQVYLENIVKPNARFRNLKGQIQCDLVFYANKYSNPLEYGHTYDGGTLERYRQAEEGLRKLASEIRGFIEIRRWYNFSIPADSDLKKVSSNLIGLSNSLWSNSRHTQDTIRENQEYVQIIRNTLKLETE